jgi:hypothetical protein
MEHSSRRLWALGSNFISRIRFRAIFGIFRRGFLAFLEEWPLDEQKLKNRAELPYELAQGYPLP